MQHSPEAVANGRSTLSNTSRPSPRPACRLSRRPLPAPDRASSLPCASASLGQPAAWGSLAGHFGLIFDNGGTRTTPTPTPTPNVAGGTRTTPTPTPNAAGGTPTTAPRAPSSWHSTCRPLRRSRPFPSGSRRRWWCELHLKSPCLVCLMLTRPFLTPLASLEVAVGRCMALPPGQQADAAAVPVVALQQFLAALRARDFEGAKRLAFQSESPHLDPARAAMVGL